MGNLQEREHEINNLRRKGEWLTVREILNPLLQEPPGATTAWAHAQMGITLYMDNPSHAQLALRHLETAQSMEGVSLRTQIMAAIQAVTVALYDDELAAAWANHRRASALVAGEAEVAPWAGRVYMVGAQCWQREAEVAGAAGDAERVTICYRRALAAAKHSAEFYVDNLGPFDASDQVCQHDNAVMLQAEVLWATGRRRDAVTQVRPILSGTHPVNRLMGEYWRGCLALEAGHYRSAEEHLKAAIQLGMTYRAHRWLIRTSIVLAEALRALGDTQQFDTLLTDLLRQAARNHNVGLVYRLQCLRDSAGEVATCGSS